MESASAEKQPRRRAFTDEHREKLRAAWERRRRVGRGKLSAEHRAAIGKGVRAARAKRGEV